MRLYDLAIMLALLALAAPAAAQNDWMDITGSSFDDPRGPSTAERHLWLAPSGSRFQRDSPARQPLPLWAVPGAAGGLYAPPVIVDVPAPEVNVTVPPAEAQGDGERQPERWVIEPVPSSGPDRFRTDFRRPPAPARWLCPAPQRGESRYVVSPNRCEASGR